MMGELNQRFFLVLFTFLLHCAPLTPAPAASSHQVFFLQPLSKRFGPKTFSVFPAVPPKTFPATVADTKKPVADGKLVPVGGFQLEEERLEQLEDVDHSPVVASVVESLNQTINKIEVNQLSREGVRKIFRQIISAVSKLLPEDLNSTSGGPAITAAEVGSDAVQHEKNGLEFDKHEMKEDEHEKEVEMDLAENEKEVEIDLADGLSIFSGWPNICNLLWFGNNFSDPNHQLRSNCYPPVKPLQSFPCDHQGF